MNKPTIELTILEKAVEAFQQQTDMNIKLNASLQLNKNFEDAVVTIDGVNFGVNVKSSVTKQNLFAVLHELSRGNNQMPVLLVTRYINPNLMDEMREAGVLCIDTAGNAYIRRDPIYIFVKGNKVVKEMPSLKIGRAFQYAGLKVIFALLQNPDLIKQSYRAIAEQTGVALGGLVDIVKDLTQQGFVLIIGKDRSLVEKERLLRRWVEHYPKLKQKHFLGAFTTDMNDWWKTIDIEQFDGVWGSEIAAESYTEYLQAKDGVVFIPQEMMTKFIKTARLKKSGSREGVQIELVEPFWNQNSLQAKKELAPALLVYADLINSKDARNLETAQRLYEQYLD
ncbi:MAG: hypothetical protein ISEC1_P0207 [Thiomicrorhabdus sp.]|nr:MAG: hypothetical protein ISEC1_P0207 [Thiomicrorhabdus sp.]